MHSRRSYWAALAEGMAGTGGRAAPPPCMVPDVRYSVQYCCVLRGNDRDACRITMLVFSSRSKRVRAPAKRVDNSCVFCALWHCTVHTGIRIVEVGSCSKSVVVKCEPSDEPTATRRRTICPTSSEA